MLESGTSDVRTERYAEALKYYKQVVSYSGPETSVLQAVKALAARQAAREYKRVGDLTKASANFQLAVEVGQQLMDSTPTPARSHEMMLACCDLGSHLAWVTQPDNARIAFQRGINVGERLLKEHAAASYRAALANLYFEAGILENNAFASDTAQDFYLRAIDLQEELRKESSDATLHETALVKLYINLGNCLKGKAPDKRLEALGKAIAIGERLVERFPETLTHRESLMTAFLNRAITFGSMSKLSEASADYGAAIEISGSESEDVPVDDRLARHRIPALVNLGLIHSKLKQTEEAVRCNEDAIRIGTRLAAGDPSQTRVRIDTAGAQVNLASILRNQGESRRALELLKSARENLADLLLSEKWNAYARTFLTNSLSTERRCYGSVLRQPPEGDDLELATTALTAAIEWSEDHLKRWPTDHSNYSLFASHLAHVRDLRARLRATHPRDSVRKSVEAVADAARACELSSYEAWPFIDTLAAAYAEVGSFNEAVERQQQAIEMAPEKQKKEMQQRLDLYLNGEAFRQALGGPGKDGPAESQEESTPAKQAQVSLERMLSRVSRRTWPAL